MPSSASPSTTNLSHRYLLKPRSFWSGVFVIVSPSRLSASIAVPGCVHLRRGPERLLLPFRRGPGRLLLPFRRGPERLLLPFRRGPGRHRRPPPARPAQDPSLRRHPLAGGGMSPHAAPPRSYPLTPPFGLCSSLHSGYLPFPSTKMPNLVDETPFCLRHPRKCPFWWMITL